MFPTFVHSSSLGRFSRIFCSLSQQRLKESQREVLELRQRLQEAVDIGEQQKAHFRSSIEQLRHELQNAVTARESVLTRRCGRLLTSYPVLY